MVFTQDAKVLTAEEIKEMIDDESMDNVVVNGLLFIETRAKDDQPGKVFPCYIYAWREEEKDGKKQLAFQADVIQFRHGEFGMIQVILHEDEFGVTKRIWDKPPTKAMRDIMPFLEEGVQ